MKKESMNKSMSIDNQNTFNYLAGIIKGWDDAGDYLLDEGAKAFRNDYDDKALSFRTIGRLLRQKAVTKSIELDEWQKEKLGQ